MTTCENETLLIELEQIEPAALSAEQLVAAADEALAGGDFAVVRQKLKEAFNLAPGEGEIALALGHAELNGGSLPDALAAYSAAAALMPNSPASHASRALALQLFGRSLEASQAACQAISLDPNHVIALKVLARIHLNSGRSDLAQQCCRRILTRHGKDGDARKMLEEALVHQTNHPEATSKPAPPKTVFPVSENLKKLEPLAGDYSARTRAWRALGPEHLLQLLSAGNYEAPIRIEQKPAPLELASDGFPAPPVDLTMGYGAGNLKHYLAGGANCAAMVRNVMARNGVTLQSGDSMLDWGGAAGRVVRNFASEARRGVNVWSCDVHAPSIEWAKSHLSPPFKFFNSQTLPHLPFADGTFKFICGFSVFTHLIVLRDMWLLELRRVLRPGGCIILTIHDENTWASFLKNGMPHWMPPELRGLEQMPGELVEIRGSSWEFCYTFFHSEYVRRIWGQYFTVAEIVPGAASYQTAVVLKAL